MKKKRVLWLLSIIFLTKSNLQIAILDYVYGFISMPENLSDLDLVDDVWLKVQVVNHFVN